MSLSSYRLRILVSLFIATFTGSSAELVVAAAADLATAQSALIDGFQKQSGATVRFSIGASGLLAKQIENGAPFDVFLSANEKFVLDLATSGKVDRAGVKIYALGRLGLWSQEGKIRELKALLSPAVKRLAIANPQLAPYGAAAKELLERQGYWKTLEPKTVFGENVSQTFQYAESGNVDAAITSWTLVFDKGGILLPQNHAPIRQAGAVVTATQRPDLAKRFLDFLVSTSGGQILADHGLTPPQAPSLN